jgi:hypothetical protein
MSVHLALVVGDDVVDRAGGQGGVDGQQIRHPRLGLGIVGDLRAVIGHGGLDLLRQRLRIVEDVDAALRARLGLRHLRARVLQIVDLRRRLEDLRFGDDEGLAEPVVEAFGEVAGQLEVLPLVLADGDELRVVEQDVRGHERRIGEQAQGHVLLLRRLVLELGHPARLPHRGRALEDPRQLRMGRHLRLDEDRRLLRIDAGRDELGGRAQRPLPQIGRILFGGDRVHVRDEVEGVVRLLVCHELLQGSDVVSEVKRIGGGLDTRDRARL